MTCAVCTRQARGFEYYKAFLAPTNPKRCSDRWVFCSMRCLNAFTKVMEQLTRLEDYAVIDPSDLEVAAMRSALAPLGEYVASIGMERPLADYRKEEVLCLIEVVITAYQSHILDEHERMAARDRAFFETRLAAQAQGSSSLNSRIPF